MSDSHDSQYLRRMESAILNLPSRQRDIFIAHRVHGLTCIEIADRTGLAIPQVRRHLAKAICRVARRMDGRPLRWWERWF